MGASGRISFAVLHYLISLAAFSCKTYVASGLPTKAADGDGDANLAVDPDDTLVRQHGVYPQQIKMDVAEGGDGERHYSTPDASVVEDHILANPHEALGASVAVETAGSGDAERPHGTPDASDVEELIRTNPHAAPGASVAVETAGSEGFWDDSDGTHVRHMDVDSEGDGGQHHSTPDASVVEELIRTDPHAVAGASVAVESDSSLLVREEGWHATPRALVAVEADGTPVQQHHGTLDASIVEDRASVAVEPDGTLVRQHVEVAPPDASVEEEHIRTDAHAAAGASVAVETDDSLLVRDQGWRPHEISIDYPASEGYGERQQGTIDASDAVEHMPTHPQGTSDASDTLEHMRTHPPAAAGASFVGDDGSGGFGGARSLARQIFLETGDSIVAVESDGTLVREDGEYPHNIVLDVASEGDGEGLHGTPHASDAVEHMRTHPQGTSDASDALEHMRTHPPAAAGASFVVDDGSGGFGGARSLARQIYLESQDSTVAVESDGTLVREHGEYPHKTVLDVASEGDEEPRHGTTDAKVEEEHIPTAPHAAAGVSVAVATDGSMLVQEQEAVGRDP